MSSLYFVYNLIVTGDLFILVYSIDNKESYEEVKRLREEVLESKGYSQTGPRPRKRPDIPMMIVGNKCDLEESREIDTNEMITYTESCPGCGCAETSAKKNINIEEIFLKLFMLAKVPTEMSPSLHRKVQPTYVSQSSGGSGSFRRGVTIRRRLSDACGAVAPNARRPSIRTDLLTLQMQKNCGSTTSLDSAKCCIQ